MASNQKKKSMSKKLTAKDLLKEVQQLKKQTVFRRGSSMPSWIKKQAVNIFGPGYSYEFQSKIWLIDMSGSYGFAFIDSYGDWEIADETYDKNLAVMLAREVGIDVNKSDLS